MPAMAAGQRDVEDDMAPLVHTKAPYLLPDLPRKIKQIRFGIMNPADIIKNAVLHAHATKLYEMPDRKPHTDGVLDTRLGISNRHHSCTTCGQTLQDCTGHFGYIELRMPVFHIGFFKQTLSVLSCICKTCSRVLLSESESARFYKAFRSVRVERQAREAKFKELLKKCKLVRNCPHCGEANGPVKKATGSLKIVHEKYGEKMKSNQDGTEAYYNEFRTAKAVNEAMEPHIQKVADDLNPLRCLALLRAIPRRDCELLDFAGRPEDLLMLAVPVPPAVIRPSVDVEGGASNEDDITMKLMQIIECNNQLRTALERGVKVEGGQGVMELWDFLQVTSAGFINSDLPGLPVSYHQPQGKPLRGFVQRLKGKQGRFRGNLSGKRVDFSGRTVISPDPNLAVDEVGVPLHVAKQLSFPERITEHNIARLRHNVLNGANKWPGANLVVQDTGAKFVLKYQDRTRWVEKLKVGDVVERHLQDGDVVLFNRQPSLHRVSIMAHRARILQSRTFRFNECVCNPYNADFDGDEMNLHVPQTQEARAEAATLMGVHANLCTPKNGDILVAATQDFLTSSYLITSKDTFYTREQFGQLMAYMGDGLDAVALPPPAIIAPQELWTGKQLFSLLVRPNAETRVMLNLETAEKRIHVRGRREMCPSDGYVVFHNSDLVCGRLGKGTLGDGNRDGLFHVLVTDYSPEVAARCMNRLAKLSARFIGNRGFSIGIDDVTPAPLLQSAKKQLMVDGYAECETLIMEHKKGILKLSPGMGADETLEAKLQGLLSNIRTEAGDRCMVSLSPHNSPLVMSQCGSKGSPVNIAQMVACVGQQVVNGERAPDGFSGRTLPHFPRGTRTPEGKGFVAASFYSGLSPTEFFFHAMGGREGLVDTAVKTAETGYMSRRLMKSLEDLHTHHDVTVRNSAGGIVQLAYGDDGLDPLRMEGPSAGQPLDLGRLLTTIRLRRTAAPEQAALPDELREEADTVFRENGLPELGSNPDAQMLVARLQPQHLTYSAAFVRELHTFVSEQLVEAMKARERLGLPPDMRADASAERPAALTGLTRAELRACLELCIARLNAKRIDPGSTVGAFGAQSIGEPGTQMTLKTFHFAGVAAMNITLGVPRIKEIINASKNISTPIITVALQEGVGEEAVRHLKASIEATTLGQVASDMQLVLSPTAAALHIWLDLEAAAALQLDISAASVADALVMAPKLKLTPRHIRVLANDRLVVSAEPVAKVPGRGGATFRLQQLLGALPKAVVAGVPTVSRAVMNRAKGGALQLFAEGTNLKAVMGIDGVDGLRTVTNHVTETNEVLGIEAARAKIVDQIEATMSGHGMSIDTRHMMLLADCMTYKGEVLGITRFGIARMKDSVLMLASFERTTDHLFDAAVHGRVDDISGVSESIIMGIPFATGGTGMTKLRYTGEAQVSPTRRPEPILG